MTEAAVAILINSLAATIPQLIALYQQITANRTGVKTIAELVADADATYQANLIQLSQN